MSQLLIPSPTGNTRIFAVVGDPVKQVKAPQLLNKVFAEQAVDAVMIAVHARPEQLATVIRGLQAMENFSGMLITIPHKFAAREFADEVSLAVQVSGSTNALRRNEQGVWEADNFDGTGFVLGLQRKGYALAGKRVVLAGGGGCGKFDCCRITASRNRPVISARTGYRQSRCTALQAGPTLAGAM
ncbi:hypothetical protein OGV25_26670 [Pseudomonas sp. P1B16]|uniref:shikimate dehydrogenase family protein n=1 Tax=Pseudomonas sp. P1B16 TaxID=2986074 RepID=UPI002A24EBE2|nr:hypothetical protein [Pseudomonas sp. P1B16]WPM26601.1 hypothetical protein OGV25_26670 [Pseudomonas sp. P1B16]